MDSELIPIDNLRKDGRNARKHTKRNIDLIEKSVRLAGAARSGVIDEDGTLLAGNGAFEAMQAAGIKTVRVVETDGSEWVVVRRKGLTEKQKRLLALADNRAAELAEWDGPALAAQGIDLLPWFTGPELEQIGAQAPTVADDGPEPQLDMAEALREQYGVNVGQIWQLGDHRLACGDSTNKEQVDRLLHGAVPFLMVTDPPYGVNYDPDWRNQAAEAGHLSYGGRAVGKVINDDIADWTPSWRLFPGSVAYTWSPGGDHVLITGAALHLAGFQIRSMIIWRKAHFAISRGAYHFQHEPCWHAVKKGAKANWCGDRSQSTVWDINHVKNETGHGTQKPVECMARPIRNHGGKDDDVYDPFLGSGTTLIACEQLGRRCFAMEISPSYVAMAIQRWVDLTGKEPQCL